MENYRAIHGKSTISMAILTSKLLVYQKVAGMMNQQVLSFLTTRPGLAC